MNNLTIDLTNCDVEPIHIPGQIQSHGFLITIDKELIIRYHSDNIHSFLEGIPSNILGLSISTIESVIGKNEPPNFINQLIVFGRNNGFDQTNPFQTDLQGKPFHLIISTSEEFYLLEFEPAKSTAKLDIQRMIGHSISEMLADKNLNNLLNNTAVHVKKLIDYDRVMIYRFAEDGHGEVVAEAKEDNLESWLGLHYPASDIPKQARELYKINLTRLIANVHSTPARIITSPEQNQKPLDLTGSQLRAVSPIHIQYLKNMKVDSSFSISLMYRKELWGLIACHNYSPCFIDYKSRQSAKLIGQILSSALEFRQDEENQRVKERYKAAVDELIKLMQKNKDIEVALTGYSITMKNVTDASGAVLVFENGIIPLGDTPNSNQLNKLLLWVKANVSESIFYTNNLASIYPEAAAYADVASGMMVSVLSRELGEYAIWFKPEQLKVINWAGDPEKPAEQSDSPLMQISPRKSFDIWSLTVAQTSTSWTNEEIQSVIRLKGEIIYSINKKASEIRVLNEKLKQAYEELDTFSFTISHDLKNPLSTIKSYSELLLRDKTISDRSLKMLERIVAGTNKMNVMIREVLEYSRIGRSELTMVDIDIKPLLEEMIKDLKIAYKADHAQVTIGETPSFKGDPVMISQIFSNLISNAIKYSLSKDAPLVTIEGKMQDDKVVYSISDNGVGIDIKQQPQVFELFKRLDNVQDIEGSGVGLAIVKRIVEKHKGKIWVESEPGRGSVFNVEFNA
ncbi:MAG: ATP-binding protein [Sphingobacteriaceae bacterium]